MAPTPDVCPPHVDAPYFKSQAGLWLIARGVFFEAQSKRPIYSLDLRVGPIGVARRSRAGNFYPGAQNNRWLG